MRAVALRHCGRFQKGFMGIFDFSRSVPGMEKRAAIWIAVVGGLLSITAPIVLSMYLAWKHNQDNQIEFIASVAQEVLRKSADSVAQMSSIYAALARAGAADPCLPENITLMGELSLRSEEIQTVGYVKDNTLLCSAYGHHDIPLGTPTFTTPSGTQVWTAQQLPISPGTEFLVLMQKDTGYTVAILPRTFLNVFAGDPYVSAGLYSLSAKRVIVGRGVFDPRWLERLGNEQQVQFTDKENFVVVRRSSRFEFASFAAEPVARVDQGLYAAAFVLVPIGVLAGALLALTILHLARQQLTLPVVLKVALKRKEFVLHYQPVVDLQTGVWVGAEALIRWRRSTGETIAPDVFIKAAEDAGLIQELTAQVMEMVGQDAREFFVHHRNFHIAINLSAADLESRGTIAGLAKLSQQTGARRGNLLVEATERGFMKAHVVKDILRDIRAMGIHIAIDDFGTGYSSLSYLETFELDYLKIDKSFVDTLGRNSATSQVVPHIIEMAKSLQLTMIAEGVETQAQARYLRDHGVQLAQGWLFARPMPFAELSAGLSASRERSASSGALPEA
ncbi:MAG: EAL domain-containing protein [Comamonas sp.]